MIRGPLTVSAGIIIAAIAVSLFTVMHADPSTLVPVHWNAAGEADDFRPLGQAMVLFPALLAGIVALFVIIPHVMPNREGLEASRSVYVWSWLGTMLTLLAFHVGTALGALGAIEPTTIPRIGLVALSILFIGIGNFVAKSRQNWVVGLRTPWTLSDPDAWIAGNRAMGWGFVVTGAAMAIGLLAGADQRVTLLLVAGALLSTLVGCIVSFLTWKKNAQGT